MAYTYSDRLDHNGRRIKELHSRAVIIHRAGNDPTIILASPQETIVEEPSENGMVIRRQYRDYTVDANEYVIGGQVVEPEYGDFIIDTKVCLVCRVVSPDDSSSVYDYITETRKRLRIHTVASQKLDLSQINQIVS